MKGFAVASVLFLNVFCHWMSSGLNDRILLYARLFLAFGPVERPLTHTP
jgi:hypothetical protein